ncbi:transposase [Scytonema hofmannii PCC 7110]|uniref:Transposase n=1 Tax=Scytonema hofmannii PCC 7110 TaxID=128403 RepID=A0A139X4G3_9CYAN|nr:hypothetical protein [Scytonema hofmannii]KYC39543.1 transposase [Scytonema hofmannii PCC 7110]
MTEQRTDYDNPWKEVIERFFPRFLEFFFPDAYAVIDWTRPPEFLDTELQQLEPDAEIGKRLVDKVAKVWLVDGEKAWILIHIEVQGQYDSQFTQRMYIYNYRLFDRHKQKVISLAVLADEEISWRPSSYEYVLAGCRVRLEFPIVKLLDYEAEWQTLEQSTNPFSVVVMAHLKTKATHRNPENRLQWKLNIVKRLFEQGYSREDVLGLFRFIDWIMVLPEELVRSFKQEVRSYEEARRMRYVTSVERLAKEEGMVQTAREHIMKILQTRFGVVPEAIVTVVNGIEELSLLENLFTSAITIGSLEQFQHLLNESTSGAS